MKIGDIRSRQRDGGYATTSVSAADLVSFGKACRRISSCRVQHPRDTIRQKPEHIAYAFAAHSTDTVAVPASSDVHGLDDARCGDCLPGGLLLCEHDVGGPAFGHTGPRA